jgi:hypothetical protein
MPPLRRITLICMVTAALALSAIQAAGANGGGGNGTRTLNGEEFLVQDVTLTLDCDPARVSTILFSASGIATGPYPGTFTVEGSVTIAAQTLPGPRTGTVAGPLLSLRERFSIDSPLGAVTGVKKLTRRQPFDQSQGSCQDVTDFASGGVAGADGTVVDVFSQPRYVAKITEPGGIYHDRGDALFTFSELDLDGTCPSGLCHFRQAAFDQFFMSTGPPPGDDDDHSDMDDEIEDEVD